mgnify:CR=1 FL=1
MTQRILVTGGAGFLGSHLCRLLLQDNNDVLCVDNYFTGSKQNISDLTAHPNFEVIRHDVTFPLYLEVDQIYNLACPASPIHYQDDPKQRKPDISLAQSELGWQPSIGLAEGLVDTIAYFKKVLAK